MQDDELRRMALFGARARLVELDAERERIYDMFPELGPRTRKKSESAVLYVAGETNRQRSPGLPERVDEQTKAQLLARFNNGESATTLAKEAGLTPSALYYWRNQAEKHGGHDGLRTKALARIAAGESAYMVAKSLGLAGSTVYRWQAADDGKPKGSLPPVNGFDEKTRQRALDRIARGESFAKVAEDIGVTPSALYKWRSVAGTSKPQKSSKASKRTNFTEDERAAIVERLKKGEGATAIGKELGIPSSTIRTWRTGHTKSPRKSAEVTEKNKDPWNNTWKPTLQVFAKADEGKADLRALMKALEITKVNTSWRMAQEVMRGHVRRLSPGVYEITEKGRAALEADTL